MPTPAAALLVLALMGSPPAAAQEAPASTGIISASNGAQLEVDLRQEYIAGDKILVQLTFRNPGSSSVTLPDLSARPWLVRFELESAAGKSQERRTKPPATDSGKTVQVPPRGSRNTLLEIPSGGALAAGSYTLGISVELGSETIQVPARQIQLVAPKPVGGQLAANASLSPTGVIQALWQHQGVSGVQLYLHEALDTAPSTSTADWFLTEIDAVADVQLSAGRQAQSWDRHLLWASGDRRFSTARLGGRGLRGEVVSFDAPWPAVVIAGRPATSGAGDLHAPLWVPAPKGDRGELRILSVGSRGTPEFQRAALMDAAPLDVQTTVSDDGTAHFLAVSSERLELYSVTAAPAPDTQVLPVPGRRILSAAGGQQVVAARFGLLPETEGYAGGLAVLAILRTEAGLVPYWISTRGTVIRELPPVAGGPDQVLGVHPHGFDTPGLLLQGPDGAARYVLGETTTTLGTLPASWALAADAKGRALLRTLDSPVASKLLEP